MPEYTFSETKRNERYAQICIVRNETKSVIPDMKKICSLRFLRDAARYGIYIYITRIAFVRSFQYNRKRGIYALCRAA